MDKKTQNEIGALLAGLLGVGGAEVIMITPREGQSMEDAIAEHEAAHREECSGCAAEHAIEQAAAKKAADEEKLAAKKSTFFDELKASAEVEAAAAVAIATSAANKAMQERDVLLTSKKDTDKREPIGYMACIVRAGVIKPIPSSFHPDRAAVAAKLELLKAFGPIEMLTKLAGIIGQDAPVVEVKPVYL